MNVVFVMVAKKYSATDVNRLYDQLKHYHLGKFYCYTDNVNAGFAPAITPLQIDPKLHLSTVWNKLHMFSDSFPVEGKIHYFDLDTVIQSNPFNVEVDWTKLTLVDCHWKPQSIVRLTNYDVTFNSSVMTWDTNNADLRQLWDHFQTSGLRDYMVKKYVGIDRYIGHEPFDPNLFARFPTAYIRSHKYEHPAKNAPVVTFEELDFGSIDLSQIT